MDTQEIPKGWKLFAPNVHNGEGSSHFWQKELSNGIFANIVEWPPFTRDHPVWELRMQIPSYRSITGETMDVIQFTYSKLDFEKIECHAVEIGNALTNPL